MVKLHIRLSVCFGTMVQTGLYSSCLFQAAFDPRVLASVCFFATDIHSATLGKGKKDNTLVRVRNGELKGKGELVVRIDPKSRASSGLTYLVSTDDFWQTGNSRSTHLQ